MTLRSVRRPVFGPARTIAIALGFALLAILLTACRAMHQPHIPRSVPSPLGPVPVLVVDSIAAPDSTQFYLGAFDPRRRVIYLRRDLAPFQKLAVLHHEICHLRLFDSGLSHLVPGRLTDAICNVWGASRAEEIRHSTP